MYKKPTSSFAFLALGLTALLGGCEACDADPIALIPEPGAIQGTVCDPSSEGTGLFGAKVYVEISFGDGSKGEISTVTNADGSFLLEDLDPGTYDLLVERGSFSTVVESVTVLEAEITELGPDTCLVPQTVTMTVFDGHDRVEAVLVRLGFQDFDIVDTHSRFSDRDENTESWLTEQFADYEDFADNDILFINCAAHEWALDAASGSEIENVLTNLRRFVDDGGSIYLSDWSYDLLERLYPDAADWLGDDTERNAAEVSVSQYFLGNVLDPTIASTIGRERANLRYELGRVALPIDLGPGSTALIVGDIDAIEDNDEFTLPDTPVLFEHRPPTVPAGSDGRIIYTTFHNGDDNTADMDEVLRAIVFAL